MWLENWGSGAKRIIEACQEQGVEEPTWRWDGGFVYVTFKRPSYKQVSDSTQLSSKQDEEPLNHRPSTDQVPPKFAPSSPQVRPKFAPSSPQVIQLVKVMGDQNYSIRELTELCGYADPKHFREGYIKPALAEKAIERLYADQPNHPKQKYRLTEGAKGWKKRLNNK